ncbi:MAG: MFS transporter [Bacteroidales bacterium]|nr:MFS transporter [Bacteroidales bacterium]
MKKTLLPFRIFLVLGSFLLTVLLYIDRTVISVAKDDISGDLGLSATQFGWIMAMFTLGYALFQTPSGKLADKYGPRAVITWIVSFWSALTALTGAAWNYTSLLIIRFVFGGGEAGAFPALAKVTYSWFPVKERGIVQGINFSGSRIGAAFALPLIAWLITLTGWRHTFAILGVAGVIFASLWYLLFRNRPEESSLISETEKEYIITNRQQQGKTAAGRLSFSTIIGSGNMWLTMLQYICSNFTFYFTLTWMYPYLKNRFALDGLEAGFFAMAPLLAGAAGNWVSGIMVDYLYRKVPLALSRRIPAVTGFVLAATGMIMMVFAESPQVSIIFLSLAIFGADMTLSPSWAFCIDIGRENAATVSGTMNMAGNLGAFVTIMAFPYMYKWTGGHETFFFICAGLSIVAVGAWFFMKPDRTLELQTNK